MYKHHQETINKLITCKKDDPEIKGILLGGSITHGFATEVSDVDVMFVINEVDYQRRVTDKNITFYSEEYSNYKQGYVDGKFVSIDFIKKVAAFGSEPARFAFSNAKVLYSEIDYLEVLVNETGKYPLENKQKNIDRFYAQFEAYYWYCGEALKHNNEYLLIHSISNLILFGGRLILAHNEMLYPYHKWFIRILSDIKDKPKGIMSLINSMLTLKDKDSINKFCELIKSYRNWCEEEFHWPSLFVKDSEWNWLDGYTPVADV